MKRKVIVKLACALTCIAMMTGAASATASAAEKTAPAAALQQDSSSYSNLYYRGPLTFETHLQARMGYSTAYYTVYLYAPYNVVGISINDMPIASGNSLSLSGSVKQVVGSSYEDITVKVTLYYEDGSTYSSYETVDVSSTWCPFNHYGNEEGRCTG